MDLSRNRTVGSIWPFAMAYLNLLVSTASKYLTKFTQTNCRGLIPAGAKPHTAARSLLMVGWGRGLEG